MMIISISYLSFSSSYRFDAFILIQTAYINHWMHVSFCSLSNLFINLFILLSINYQTSITFISLKHSQNTMKVQSKPSPYFENQSYFSLRCGLHAVNNFLGKKVYTQKQFSTICQTLEEQSQQKFQHFFGGDYDVSVLIKALHDKHYDVQWHDARKEFTKTLKQSETRKTLQGYLVNVNIEKFYHKFLGVSGRHWVSVKLTKNDKGQFVYKMDSKDKNFQILNENQLIKYLEQQRMAGAQILKVFPAQNTEKQQKQPEKQQSKPENQQTEDKKDNEALNEKESSEEKEIPKGKNKK